MTAAPQTTTTPAPQPSTANVWAIISLITGLLGCMFITPIIAIVTGFIGIATAKPPKGGKGMAIAGIILGFLWIGVGIGSYFVIKMGVSLAETLVANVSKEPTIAFLNSLQEGDFEGVKDHRGSINQDKLKALAAELKPLGKCQDIEFLAPTYQNVNGVVTINFTGKATFENGQRTLKVQLRSQNDQLVFEQLDLK